MKIQIEDVVFPSEAELPARLRGKLHTFGDGRKRAVAVVCHPSSAGECDMEHALVVEPCRALNEAGFITLRLNFRGVGGSEGALSKGKHETGDLRGALDFLAGRDDVDRRAVYTVGHSFGSAVALKVATEDARVKGFAAMGCPLMLVNPLDSFYFRHYELDVRFLRSSPKHKLLIWGELDHLASRENQAKFLALLPSPCEHHVVAGGNHFLSQGKRMRPLPAMAGEAAEVIARHLTEWRRQDLGTGEGGSPPLASGTEGGAG